MQKRRTKKIKKNAKYADEDKTWQIGETAERRAEKKVKEVALVCQRRTSWDTGRLIQFAQDALSSMS